MPDAPSNATSEASSDATSASNAESAATSITARGIAPQSSKDAPSLDEQVAKVMALTAKPLSDGQEGYVISERWLARVFARTSDNKNKPELFDKTALEGEIGPVDNSDVVDPTITADDLSDQNGEDFIPLRPGLSMGQDFEILPDEAWELILSWYGLKEGSPVIRRYVHNTALDQQGENLQYEIYPPIFTIRKVGKKSADASKRTPKLVASRSDGFVEFLRAAKKAAGIDLKTKVRVWRVLITATTDQPVAQASGMLTPESSERGGSPVSATRNASLPLIIDEDSFIGLAYGTERELVAGKDETANEKYNGRSSLHILGLAEDQVLILEEQNANGEYNTETSTKAINSSIKKQENTKSSKTTKGLQSTTTSGRNSPAPSGPMTRGRTRNGRTRGTVGLSNLGNTCYMNSALQCIRSVEELCFYFLSKSGFDYPIDVSLT
jgi:ubiquitin carboxyl-terminal hydrolase 4/11/15